MLEERYMKIRLKNKEDRVKVCKAGFSFTTLFFGPFVPLYRADFLWTGIMFIFHMVLNYIVSKFPIITSARTLYGFLGVTFISNIIFAFIYNRIYLKNALLDGFVGYDKEDDEKLIKKHLSVTSKQIEAYKNKKQERLNKKEEKRALKEVKEKENRGKKKEREKLKDKEEKDKKNKSLSVKEKSENVIKNEEENNEEIVSDTENPKKKGRKKKKSKKDSSKSSKEDTDNKEIIICETIDDKKENKKSDNDKADIDTSAPNEEENNLISDGTSEITTDSDDDITKENEVILPQEA